MKVSQEIEEIVYKMMESFMEVDDSICWLGANKYKEFHEEFSQKTRFTNGCRPSGEFKVSKYHTACGSVHIKIDPKLHPDHVSVGRITLLDFLIEEMLLGDEKILDKYDPIADSNLGYYIGPDFSTEPTSKDTKSVHKRSLK